MGDTSNRFEASWFVYPWSSEARKMLRRDCKMLKQLKDGVEVSVPATQCLTMSNITQSVQRDTAKRAREEDSGKVTGRKKEPADRDQLEPEYESGSSTIGRTRNVSSITPVRGEPREERSRSQVLDEESKGSQSPTDHTKR